jgi:hypothetical protein
MRLTITTLSVLLLADLAAGQVTVISGFAPNWVPAPGAYAAPFVPLVNTPSVSLDNPPAPFVGGSPVSAGQSGQMETASPSVGPTTPSRRQGANGHVKLGAATFQSDYQLGQLAASSRNARPAAHIYTNQDVETLNRTNGKVSYGNKSEHLE